MSSVSFEIYDSHVQTNFGPIQSSSQSLLGVQRAGHDTGYPCPSNYKVKMGGAIPPLPHMSSWHAMVQLYLHP